MAGGGAWSADGTILFAPGLNGGLYKVSAQGGQPQPYTTLDASRSEHAHLWPQFLPDGRHFIFFGLTEIRRNHGGLRRGAGPPGPPVPVRRRYQCGLFAPGGRRLRRMATCCTCATATWWPAASMPPELVAEGEPFTLAPDIGAVRSLSLAPVSVSSNAILAYQSVGAPPASWSGWTAPGSSWDRPASRASGDRRGSRPTAPAP